MAFYVTPVKAVFIADTEADTAEADPASAGADHTTRAPDALLRARGP